ncbi:FeoC-like transcriptional regulator [Chloroflexus sp.]|uniref:FeoC-like transcriptional regulator n=1 Tax=Chloroflexus sp. TaxID=1904827 RepID=UPI002ACD4815|nr:FeoC-like transcriptional regulator [Chloroflexus sp.]
MLYQILEILEQAEQPLSLAELSQRLQVEPSALEGMIAFWVRKGRLRDTSALSCGGTGAGCTCNAHPQGCPFSSARPRMVMLID